MKAKYASGELVPEESLACERVQADIGKCLFAAQFSHNKIVLDVASGKGYISSYLKRNAKKVVGGDISRAAIEYAASHYKKDDLHYLLLDAQRLPFLSGCFDLVVSVETIEHLPKPERFLGECQRVLKDGGIFICSTPNKTVASPGTKRTSSFSHAREFYPVEFRRLLQSYFPEVTLYSQIQKSKIERIYIRWRTLILPVFNFFPQIQRIITFLGSLRFPSTYRTRKLAEIHEDDFTRVFEKRYWPSPVVDTPLLTLIMIAVARKQNPDR